MNEMMNLLENEEVVETVVEDVLETGSKLSTGAYVGVGVGIILAGYAIYKTAPKAIGAVRNRFAKKKEDRIETEECNDGWKDEWNKEDDSTI
jgi:hypothetical protein